MLRFNDARLTLVFFFKQLAGGVVCVVAGQLFASFKKIPVVQKLDEGDYVAASVAATTIPDLLFYIDRKAISPSTERTRTCALDVAAQSNPTLVDNAFDWNGASKCNCFRINHALDPVLRKPGPRTVSSGLDGRLWGSRSSANVCSN